MYDVGGEHKVQWQAIIEDQNPNGIIYIIDTTQPEEEAIGLKHIAEVYQEIRTHTVANRIRLNSILILLNKCDLWGTSPEQRERMMTHYRDEVLRDAIRELRREFGRISIQLGAGSLTNTEHTYSTNEAIRRFVVSLVQREQI